MGGNLVAVQASRLSTALHQASRPGVLPEDAVHGCPNLCSTFCGKSTIELFSLMKLLEQIGINEYANTTKSFQSSVVSFFLLYKNCQNTFSDMSARTARVLMLMVIPGHLIFMYTIHYMEAGHTSITFIFAIAYLTAACIQVCTLFVKRICL